MPITNRIIQLPVAVISQAVTIVTAGVAVALPAKRLFGGITIKPHPGNTGDKVYVGPSSIDNTGFSLSLADKESTFVECEQLEDIFVDADTSGDKVLILGG